jgi:uncharacterized protein (TIGR02001 family)
MATSGGYPQLMLALLSLGAAPSTCADWGGSIGVSSDYVVRGITESDDRPAVQGDLHYRVGDGTLTGAFGGVSASSIRRAPDSGTAADLSGYLGYARSFSDDWSGKLMYVHYAWPGTMPRRVYDYDEFSATAGWRDRVFGSVAWSPDRAAYSEYGGASGRSARACDLFLRQPLPKAFSADAGIGYQDLRGLAGQGYYYWNAGLGYELGQAQLDVSYVGSAATPPGLYADGYPTHHWTVTLLWNF